MDEVVRIQLEYNNYSREFTSNREKLIHNLKCPEVVLASLDSIRECVKVMYGPVTKLPQNSPIRRVDVGELMDIQKGFIDIWKNVNPLISGWSSGPSHWTGSTQAQGQGLCTRERIHPEFDSWSDAVHDVEIRSNFGATRIYKGGVKPVDIVANNYTTKIEVRKKSSTTWQNPVDLGEGGIMPLEMRFLHDPKKAQGFLGCGFFTNVFLLFKKPDTQQWATHHVINVPSIEVEGWDLSKIPGVMTDMIISKDDKFLFMCLWAHGEIRKYDISNPTQPKLIGNVFVGGLNAAGANIKEVTEEHQDQPPPLQVNGRTISGGPQAMQLSLDGKRLYVTISPYGPWDKEFYPNLKKSVLIRIEISESEMSVNQFFLVDLVKEPDDSAN